MYEDLDNGWVVYGVELFVENGAFIIYHQEWPAPGDYMVEADADAERNTRWSGVGDGIIAACIKYDDILSQ